MLLSKFRIPFGRKSAVSPDNRMALEGRVIQAAEAALAHH